MDDPGNYVLLYDRPGLHADGGHALFADGNVKWMDGREVDSAVRATTNGLSEEGREAKVGPVRPPP
jgi:prepilin-type processing-associated H-X9-DG protein